MFLESLSPSCVIEFIFSGTTAIFQNFMNFFAPYPFQEIAPKVKMPQKRDNVAAVRDCQLQHGNAGASRSSLDFDYKYFL